MPFRSTTNANLAPFNPLAALGLQSADKLVNTINKKTLSGRDMSDWADMILMSNDINGEANRIKLNENQLKRVEITASLDSQ